jgi:1,2-diacylglycerol 3-alpha-glucosyltransferase
MTKLTIVSDLFAPSIGGTETVTAAMAANLPAQGFETVVLAPSGPHKKTPYTQKTSNGYNVERFRSFSPHVAPNLRFGWRPYKQLAQYFDRVGQPDIIHANNLFPLSRAAMKYARKNQIPLVIGSHLMPESITFGLSWLPGVQRGLNKFGWRYIASVYNKADMLMSPTNTGIRYLKRNGLKIPTRAISNGLDLAANTPLDVEKSTMRKKLGITGDHVLMYAGRLSVEKRIDIIIDAFAREYQTFNATLILLGDGNATRRLKRQVKKLGIKNNVVFTGYVQETSRKRQYFAASDGFVIASPVELQSIVTMEAMAAGLPVLAARAGALPELCQNDVNGFTFKDGDSTNLADKMYTLLSSEKLRIKFSKASLEIISHHDIRDTWKQYKQMYADVLGKHSSN